MKKTLVFTMISALMTFSSFATPLCAGSSYTWKKIDTPINAGHPILSVYNGKLYAFGGGLEESGADRPYTDVVWSYDSTSEQWQRRPGTLPYPTQHYSNSPIRINDKLIISPKLGPTSSGGWGSHNKVIEYNFIKDVGSETAAYPYSRIWSNLLANTSDGRVYSFGGWTGNGVNKIFRYDTSAKTLTQISATIVVPFQPGGYILYNGQIIVFENSGNFNSNTVEFFDTDTETMVYKGDILPDEFICNGSVFCWKDNLDNIFVTNPQFTTVYLFDPVSKIFTQSSVVLPTPYPDGTIGGYTYDDETGNIYLAENLWITNTNCKTYLWIGYTTAPTSTTTTSTTTSTTTTTPTSTTTSTTTTLPLKPIVTTGAAIVDPTSATLNGVINPNGFLTFYYFKYGKMENYGSVTAIETIEPGTTDVPVTAYIAELSQDTHYYYQLVAYNASHGMSYGKDMEFTTSTANVITDSKAIIVAGGGPYEQNKIWDGVEAVCAYAYNTLRSQGYTGDTIYFLSPNTLCDLNGDGITDVDANATAENLKHAVKSWAQDVRQLVLFLVGHGGVEKFEIGEKEELGVQSLDAWLDEMQDNLIDEVLVVYDACRSGSFLPLLIPPPGKARFIAASAQSDESALMASTGTVSFSYYFWSRIRNGHTFWDSFLSAKKSLGIGYQDRQNAQIDGNGNGIGNEREDKELAREVRLGLELQLAGKIPVVGSVSVSPQTISVGDSVVVSAKDVGALEGVARVWAVITPPWNAASPDGPVTDLPIVDLAGGNGSYEGTFEGFIAQGEYNIAVFVIDKQGFISMPEKTTVTAIGGCLAVGAGLGIQVPCAEYQGNQYGFTLDFYRNQDDLSGYYWKLVMDTLTTGTGSDCIPIAADLSMPMDCVSYNGTQYGFTLRFYSNSYDPSGLYWKMDMRTLAVNDQAPIESECLGSPECLQKDRDRDK